MYRTSQIALPLLALLLWAGMRLPCPMTWDGIQFALALDQYDVSMHLPHPPGYFLYVMLGRLIRLLTHDGWTALLAIGGFGAAAATWLTLRAARDVAGRGAAIIAGLLAAACPLMAADSGQGHTHVPACALSALVGWCCIRLWGHGPAARWPLPVSAVAMAALAGIRPSDAALLAPLWLASAGRRGWANLCAGVLFAGLCTAAWVVPMSLMSGGLGSFLQTLGMLMGGFVAGHSPMVGGVSWFGRNVDDVLLGIVGVLGVGTPLPPLLLPRGARLGRKLGILLALWMLPALAVFIFLHIGKVYYLLTIAPALWMMAGIGGARLARSLGTRRSLPLLLVLGVHAAFLLQVHGLRADVLRSWRQVASELRGLPAQRTVVLAPSVPREEATDPVMGGGWDFRHAQWFLPQLRTVLFPTDDASRVGRFNCAWRRRTLEVPVPVRLTGVEWLVLTSRATLRALPPGSKVSEVRTSKLTVYRLRCDPTVPLVIGPGLRLRCSPR